MLVQAVAFIIQHYFQVGTYHYQVPYTLNDTIIIIENVNCIRDLTFK